MEIGLNHEISRLGKRYHVQTEDSGMENPVFTTHLFLSGTIIETVTSRYDDLIRGGEGERRALQRRMRVQHQAVIDRLEAGDFDRAGSTTINNPRGIPLASGRGRVSSHPQGSTSAPPVPPPAAPAPAAVVEDKREKRRQYSAPAHVWKSSLSLGRPIGGTALSAYSPLGDD